MLLCCENALTEQLVPESSSSKNLSRSTESVLLQSLEMKRTSLGKLSFRLRVKSVLEFLKKSRSSGFDEQREMKFFSSEMIFTAIFTSAINANAYFLFFSRFKTKHLCSLWPCFFLNLMTLPSGGEMFFNTLFLSSSRGTRRVSEISTL